jgi:hypothetical protein
MKHGIHFENATATSLGVFRAAVFALWLGLFASSWPGLLPPVPELFQARGLWLLLPKDVLEWIIGPAGMDVLPWVFIPTVLAAALGLRPFRLWASLAFLCILVFDGVSLGLSPFAYHAHAFALVIAGILIFSPAADGFVLGGGKTNVREASAYRFPLLLITAVGLLCYTMIGVHRFARGDYRVFANEEVAFAWLINRSVSAYPDGFDFGLTVATTPWLFALYRIGFVVSTVMEVASFACLRWRAFARIWLLFFTAFHFLSLVTMNIFFWENTILLWLLFLPLGVWLPLRAAKALKTVTDDPR